jgi:lipopolysaccharide/colanic/teichoic acid biosynthesis glycosyltransferase
VEAVSSSSQVESPAKRENPVDKYWLVKRVSDIFLVALGTPVAVLLIAACALAIWLTMGRPVLFIQNRVGYRGRIFRMYKLRTMEQKADGSVSATAKHDPRVTPLGRVLRLSHFDELPQLLNILKGDMTLIGPASGAAGTGRSLQGRLPGLRSEAHGRAGTNRLGAGVVRIRHQPGGDEAKAGARSLLRQ